MDAGARQPIRNTTNGIEWHRILLMASLNSVARWTITFVFAHVFLISRLQPLYYISQFA
jgi:hypothetical protein